MIPANLCFLLRDNQVCLAMKKRGFGAGKWNGSGGKVANDETMTASAVRELSEELGVEVAESALDDAGVIDFFFVDHPDWNTRVQIYRVHSWEGEPSESEEMAPQWYPITDIPYDAMWADDQYWLPLVLAGKTIVGTFTFSADGSVIDSYTVREVLA